MYVMQNIAHLKAGTPTDGQTKTENAARENEFISRGVG